MPVVFGPYLKRAGKRARKRVAPSESETEEEPEATEEPDSVPKRKFVLWVLAGAAVAWLWRRRRS